MAARHHSHGSCHGDCHGGRQRQRQAGSRVASKSLTLGVLGQRGGWVGRREEGLEWFCQQAKYGQGAQLY